MSCLKTLQEKGYKLTPQRRLIVDIIHDAAEHLTAEDIIAKVQKKMPGVNKSTIYRTLDILEETGCVVKSESETISFIIMPRKVTTIIWSVINAVKPSIAERICS